MKRIAHSENVAGKTQSLMDHLKGVASLTSQFARKFGAEEIGYLLGLYHDIGKFTDAFDAKIHGETEERVDHSSAGAYLTQDYSILSFPIAGHHTGIPSVTKFQSRITKKDRPDCVEAIEKAREEISLDVPDIHLPQGITDNLSGEMFTRMLFSCLVDADWLDTEAHYDVDGSRQGERLTFNTSTLADLWLSLKQHQEEHSGKKNDDVNRTRHEIYLDCLEASCGTPGFYRLSVPTGGGKTLSGLAFGLNHAIHNGMDRVIVVAPYTTIIDQTVRVYRGILGEDAVVEHHSATENVSIATENWDAPLIVTTGNQFFQSLFSNRRSWCRKLHNICNSVVILDEAQTLPYWLLEPTMDVLRELIDHYGVTVVLSTATQPALDESPSFNGLPNVQEIVKDPSKHFNRLRRVEYQMSLQYRWSWDDVATEMVKENQSLCIVNTKKKAKNLYKALVSRDVPVFHLSKSMCGKHRSEVIEKVREALKEGHSCYVVSTQLIEAGVDLDFPLVLREKSPLDSIVQGAGRCNREGKLDKGRVVVFSSKEEGYPNDYFIGIGLMETFVRGGYDFHDPATATEYFRRYYQGMDLDKKKIQEFRGSFDFPEVSNRYRFIEEGEVVAAVVPYDEVARKLIEEASHEEKLSRGLLRKLQPYIIDIRERYATSDRVEELAGNIMDWVGEYDSVYGVDVF